ncbi:MAG: alginate export family protein [Planctomycetota bacterium]|nr:alginate export family protein [Planctomycetota bacterium]
MNLLTLGGRSVALSLAFACNVTLAQSSGSRTDALGEDPVLDANPIQALALAQGAPATSGPWRLSEALGTPDWFEIKGTLRHRYEAFDEQFRASGGGENHAFVHRALVEMTVRDEFLSATAELEDSRVYSGVSNAPMNTGIVNTVELLQGYVAGDFTDAFEDADELRVQLGRHTMDVGSRRLVARNRFRNTINAFNGVNAQWRSRSGVEARAFYTLPVQRLPRSASELYDGDVRFDEERSSVRFWGGHALFPQVAAEMDAEFYLFGIDESDADGLNTRDRDLITFGTRWQKPRAAGDFFWELESVFQTGESRSSSGSNQDLDHDASFHHVSLGYAFEDENKSRVEALFDYASGDDDPNDGENNRFDTLFGARRFEFGPTGIFGAFARSNLVSPGIRFVTKPAKDWELMLTHRFHRLASDRDAWTTSGLVDPTGNSGDDLGTLSEFRVRYDIAPKSLRLEFGMAYLSAGSFIENAPNATTQGDTLYGYVQTNFTF